MFLDKTQSKKDPVSSSSNQPIKSPDTNHQPIKKSVTHHRQHSQPITNHVSSLNGTEPAKPVNRTNGPMLSGYIPNPPVRNPLKVTIPNSKPARPRIPQSAAEQLGVRSPPPMRVNGGINQSLFDSYYVCLCFFFATSFE